MPTKVSHFCGCVEDKDVQGTIGVQMCPELQELTKDVVDANQNTEIVTNHLRYA